MRSRVRAFALVALVSLTLWGGDLRADGGYIRVENSQLLLEHLVRQADAVLSEVNLVRAGHFMVSPSVIQSLPSNGWARRFYSAVLVDPRNSRLPIDFMIAKQLQQLRVQALMLYDLWTQSQNSSLQGQLRTQLVQQFGLLNRAYYNGISATYFYIEVLRRTFIVPGCQDGSCPGMDTLVRRLRNIEYLAHEILQVMNLIRRCQAFQFPLPRRGCVENPRINIRINISLDRPEGFVSLPYYANNQYWVPTDLAGQPQQGNTYTPDYNMSQWNQRFNYANQDPYYSGQQPGQGGDDGSGPSQQPFPPPGGQQGGFGGGGQPGQQQQPYGPQQQQQQPYGPQQQQQPYGPQPQQQQPPFPPPGQGGVAPGGDLGY